MTGRRKFLAAVILLALIWAGWNLTGQNGGPGENARAGSGLDAPPGSKQDAGAWRDGRADTKDSQAGSGQADPAGSVQPGARAAMAPDFTLADLEGRQVRLSDFRGKKVLINFWTTWCPPCVQEMPLLQKFHDRYGGGWQLLTVNITRSEKGAASVQSYIRANNYTFPVLLDEKGAVSALYKVNSIPASFILNEKGEVIRTKIGPFTEKELDGLGSPQ